MLLLKKELKFACTNLWVACCNLRNPGTDVALITYLFERQFMIFLETSLVQYTLRLMMFDIKSVKATLNFSLVIEFTYHKLIIKD